MRVSKGKQQKKKKDALMPRKKKSPRDGGTWRERRTGVVFKKECQ